MEFGNGALLAGMALGAIPVIIHLINRHRAKLRRFAAIDFLLLSDKRLARRLHLKQLLVLALRVLLLVALALALAKPYVEPDLIAAPDASDPGSVAIVIDDSTSMQARGPSGATLLDDALAHARELIASGGARTSFAIIAAGAPARLLTRDLTYDKEALGRALERIDGRSRGADLGGALREAGRVLSAATEARRQIYLIGDQAAHAWRDLALSWSYVPASSVEVVDLRAGGPLDNLAIVGASVTRGTSPAGPTLEIAAEVVNFGIDGRDAEVTLELGDRVIAERVTVPANNREQVVFNLRAPPDATHGVVRTSGDALPADDAWYFTLAQHNAVNVLVVNGSPRNVAFEDEIFFLRAALRARHAGDVALNPVFATSAELKPGQLNAMDVVVLANVGTLTREQQLGLTNFVEAGGGLFIAVGDELDDRTGASYGDLLPFPLRGAKTVAKADDPAAPLTALSIATVDFEHPVVEVFDGVDDASLFKAWVYSYMLLDTVGRPGARVVASYTGGIPALVEGTLGRGRVMMLTTSVDRDWSDLALRSSFPPLVQRICQHLARSLDRPAGPGHRVGDPVRVPAPEGQGPLVWVTPDGTRLDVEENPDDALVGTVTLEAPDQVGQHTLMRAGDVRRAVHFAVNVDRVESDLAPVTPDAVRAAVAEMTRDNGILPDAGVPEETLTASTGGDSRRTILWPYILAGLFLLFGAEAWLVVRS